MRAWAIYTPSMGFFAAAGLVLVAGFGASAVSDFVAATRRADRAGFDMVELHAAHGYLLATFISPLTNHRTDEYSGALANRTEEWRDGIGRLLPAAPLIRQPAPFLFAQN